MLLTMAVGAQKLTLRQFGSDAYPCHIVSDHFTNRRNLAVQMMELKDCYVADETAAPATPAERIHGVRFPTPPSKLDCRLGIALSRAI
jgi:hypothetical protein